MARSVRLTYEDYLHLPPDRRWELIEGAPRVVPAPNRRHQTILLRLSLVIGRFLEENGGGSMFFAPFDAVLSDIDVFQPDIVFVSDADMEVLNDDNVRGNPTWVVEVLSNPYYERDKFKRYEVAGVGEYWLVNPYEDTLSVSFIEGVEYTTPLLYEPPQSVRPRCLPGIDIDLSYVLRRE